VAQTERGGRLGAERGDEGERGKSRTARVLAEGLREREPEPREVAVRREARGVNHTVRYCRVRGCGHLRGSHVGAMNGDLYCDETGCLVIGDLDGVIPKPHRRKCGYPGRCFPPRE